ncbi:MAG: hypothetical protein M9962_00435 [Oligoflexia bacterium]|nr:hypothetical protein [Oligoflexia bacterium]
MSAYLDKSQGITFVYSNLFDIYKKAKEAKIDEPFVAERTRVLKNSNDSIKKFEPKVIDAKQERVFPVPMGVREAEEKARIAAEKSANTLRKNLGELNHAHDRLKYLLQELDLLTKKK